MIDTFEIERKFALDASSLNVDERSIEGASLSSDAQIMHSIDGKNMPVELVHDKSAIRMAGDSIPLLWSHDMKQPIGKITNIRIEDGRTRGKFIFSRNTKAKEVWQDIQDGFLRDTSVKASPIDFDEDDGVIRVTSWNLVEGSVVTLGADSNVGLDRAKSEDKDMDEKSPDKATETGSGDFTVADLSVVRERNLREGAEVAVKAERKRTSNINQMFERHLSRGAEVGDLLATCLSNDTSVERAGSLLLDLLGSDQDPIATDFQQSEKKVERSSVTMGDDALDKYMSGAGDALAVRAGVADEEILERQKDNPYLGHTLSELANEYLRVKNVNTGGLNRIQMVGMALERAGGIIGHTTDDFGNLLENVANKSMLQGFQENPETWRQWCSTGSVQDFKEFSRVNTSLFPDLDEVAEGAEFPYKTMSDLKETGQLLTYGALFSISRQAIINDDLRGMTAVPANMGRSASRKIGDLAYGILTANAALNQDATAIFDAGHSNIGTAGLISVTTVNEIKTLMALQTDPSGATLNIRPNKLVCPVALEMTASVLRNATYDPAGTAGTLPPNPVAGSFDVIADARLDSFDAAAWYMMGGPGDTVEVTFLNGQEAPFLEQQQGFTVDGATYKVRVDATATALDFRAMAYNAGP